MTQKYTHVHRIWLLSMSIFCIILAVIIVLNSTSLFPIKTALDRSSPLSPTWTEHKRDLTAIEQATMSSDFAREFTDGMARDATITPTPILRLDLSSTSSGDMIPPTVTVQSPPEGAVISDTRVCFPLWVSDNMTPWQQLTVRIRLDSGSWSDWSTQLSYCFDHLPAGLHHFHAEIQDVNGNVSPDVVRTFTVIR